MDMCDPLHTPLGKAEAGIKQHAAVVSNCLLPDDNIMFRFKQNPMRMRVKRAERCRDSIHLRRLQPASAQSRFERLIFFKPAHDHQPVYDSPFAGDCEPRCRGRERNYV